MKSESEIVNLESEIEHLDAAVFLKFEISDLKFESCGKSMANEAVPAKNATGQYIGPKAY